MDWSQYSIPAMQLEARFGDRVVPAFCERPKSIWAMVSDAASRNPDGEALVCGERRMSWREVAQHSAQIAAGLRKLKPLRKHLPVLLETALHPLAAASSIDNDSCVGHTPMSAER